MGTKDSEEFSAIGRTEGAAVVAVYSRGERILKETEKKNSEKFSANDRTQGTAAVAVDIRGRCHRNRKALMRTGNGRGKRIFIFFVIVTDQSTPIFSSIEV